MEDRIQLWNDLAAQLGVDSIRCTTAAGSGHPTSSLSAAHLVAVLFADHLRIDVGDPKGPQNDRFILSKGHAAPVLYAALKAIGAIDNDQLMSLRRLGSPIQGHPAPSPELPWVEAATGSLGQGPAVAFGMGLAMRLDDAPGRVWVLLGDSEMAEGSVWEAIEAIGYHGVEQVTCILDLNRLGQRGPTMHGWDGDVFVRRGEAFGWAATSIDGHDVAAIDAAYREAAEDGRPTLIVARTEKGHGVSEVADQEGWHGKAFPEDLAERAIAELGGERSITITPPKPESWIAAGAAAPRGAPAPAYREAVATRKAFGETLAWLAGERSDVVALDGEVANSTYTENVLETAPERFVEVYIAEQTMIGAQIGLQALGKTAFAATFGAFLTRAADQIRMASIGRADLRISGSHAGVSIGEDGPSQMALEDLALFRALDGSTVLYPADANATAELVQRMAETPGISYLRTTRESTPIVYEPGDRFEVGGSRTVRDGSDVTLIGAGITLHGSIRAADLLSEDGISARVIDCYSVKPIDVEAIHRAMDDTGLLVVVEDHRVEGGLGDAVLDALASAGPLVGRVVKLGVAAMPGSGTPEELRGWAGIDAESIVRAVRAARPA